MFLLIAMSLAIMLYYARRSFQIISQETQTLKKETILATESQSAGPSASVLAMEKLAHNVSWLAVQMTCAYFVLWGLPIVQLLIVLADLERPVWFNIVSTLGPVLQSLVDCMLIWRSPMYRGHDSRKVDSASNVSPTLHVTAIKSGIKSPEASEHNVG
jgi:hypothetical protein